MQRVHNHYYYIDKIEFDSEMMMITMSTDISDPLSPPLPIVHCFWQVFRATSCIGTELLYVESSWSSCLCSSMCRGPQKYITFELVPTPPAVFCLVSWGCKIHQLHLCGGVRPSLTSVLDMTLNNLMVRFQQCWSFGECRVALHCHCFRVHFRLGVVAPDRALSMG